MIKYYPFELHTHTIHSDGSMNPRTLVVKAKERGLRGLAITDHNTTSAVNEVIALGKEFGITVIPGIEWTTFYGHITILGGHTKVNWRELTLSNINEKLKEVTESGDIANIAHPKRAGSPLCTGCYFEYKITDYSNVTGYEVWSNAKPSFNISNTYAKAEYDSLLGKGVRLACIYGDDWHEERNNRKQYAMTYLGIDGEVNAESAIIALKNQRTYISTGLTINMSINNGKDNFNIGDYIKSGKYNIGVEINLTDGYSVAHRVEPLKAILKGNAVEERECSLSGNNIKFENVDVKSGYFRLEIAGNIDGEEGTLLISSPIYAEVE